MSPKLIGPELHLLPAGREADAVPPLAPRGHRRHHPDPPRVVVEGVDELVQRDPPSDAGETARRAGADVPGVDGLPEAAGLVGVVHDRIVVDGVASELGHGADHPTLEVGAAETVLVGAHLHLVPRPEPLWRRHRCHRQNFPQPGARVSDFGGKWRCE